MQLHHALYFAGCTAFPKLKLTEPEFLRFLRHRFGEAPPTKHLDPEECFLVAAAGYDRSAFAEIYTRYFTPIQQLPTISIAAADLEDVKHTVLLRLVEEDTNCRPRIWKYGGTGRLDAMVRISVSRAAIDFLRRHNKSCSWESRDSESLRSQPSGARAHEQRRQQVILKQALHAAIDKLTPRDAMLIKLHILRGVTLPALATMHSVHRATVVRWLAKARQTLLQEMARTIGTTTANMGSWLTSLGPDVDFSLSRLMKNSAPSIAPV